MLFLAMTGLSLQTQTSQGELEGLLSIEPAPSSHAPVRTGGADDVGLGLDTPCWSAC